MGYSTGSVVTPRSVVSSIICLPCSRNRETLGNNESDWGLCLVKNVGWVEDEEALFLHGLGVVGEETGHDGEGRWNWMRWGYQEMPSESDLSEVAASLVLAKILLSGRGFMIGTLLVPAGCVARGEYGAVAFRVYHLSGFVDTNFHVFRFACGLCFGLGL